ncbi:hypothetical protein [Dysosmobacter sp.]|uniref:hypothetical protein n=1 Tax=Dysosmobacter sp. TaxID=2591382 RepID=UPI002A84C80E|nr:hypothetical protein [Dysosmobacter sp.]MDY3282561.1 hypothetical protein [Dysosmobacter sp.]
MTDYGEKTEKSITFFPLTRDCPETETGPAGRFRRKQGGAEKNLKKDLQKKKRHDILNNALWRGNRVQKEVNESNERRNPSQLSADYDYLRLR